MAFWNCKKECWGEDARIFESEAVPIMRRHDGFVRAMLLGVPGATRRIAFTVWRDRDAYDAFLAGRDLERITRMFEHMYVAGGRPDPVEYEVYAQDGAPW